MKIALLTQLSFLIKTLYMKSATSELSRAQISSAAIQRLYIAMRHLFNRGSYKPLGVSGEAMINALLQLKPEIYGSINDPEKVELSGLLYVFQRLPQGIEECSFVKLISREGYENSSNEAIVPAKRRRNCYRIDRQQMYVEMTRGRSDIYDILTHLTFLFIESEKIRRNALDHKGRKKRDWLMLEKIIEKINNDQVFDKNVANTYLSTLLGRTYEETSKAVDQFEEASKVNNLFSITYWLGYNSIQEYSEDNDREISFSSALREKIGHHIFGASWAYNIKVQLAQHDLLERPIHIVSSNLHSVMNSLYAQEALIKKWKNKSVTEIAEFLSQDIYAADRQVVHSFALKNGMIEVGDQSGVNIGVQIIDSQKLNARLQDNLMAYCDCNEDCFDTSPVLIVMDYAFGEQAYELMDELLKPYEEGEEKTYLDVKSINIMGKAGILEGQKGDIMVPDAHVFEGSADNYPFKNDFDASLFDGTQTGIYKGPMITVMGTSLQNKDILRYFLKSSWKVVGLEMEGAHYQKAIQSASKIRGSISHNVQTRYAYYASDNPLETGSTLASGGLGLGGVQSTYLITLSILKSIYTKAD